MPCPGRAPPQPRSGQGCPHPPGSPAPHPATAGLGAAASGRPGWRRNTPQKWSHQLDRRRNASGDWKRSCADAGPEGIGCVRAERLHPHRSSGSVAHPALVACAGPGCLYAVRSSIVFLGSYFAPGRFTELCNDPAPRGLPVPLAEIPVGHLPGVLPGWGAPALQGPVLHHAGIRDPGGLRDVRLRVAGGLAED